MRLVKTEEKLTCSEHGVSVKVRIIYYGHPPMEVCNRCLNEAIDQYQEPLVCTDCGVVAKKGFGLEKKGKMILLCLPCQTKRLFGGHDAELG